MAITAGKLHKLYQSDPDNYLDELDNLLGKTVDESGYRVIRDPVFKPRQLSILDLGEAFLGREGLRSLYEHGPLGMRGGQVRSRPRTASEGSGWGGMAFEEVGGGALGPSQFQDINAWLGTVDGLLGAELMAKYELATMVARELVTWKMQVRVQENKIVRYGFPTQPTEDLQPGQEFPAGDLTHDWVRANRMRKQGEAISLTWEAMHFDQTDSIMESISGEQGLAIRFAVIIDERIQKSLWGIDNTYNRLGTITNTYLTTGAYINQQTLALLENNDSIDKAEQILLAQTDPNTGLEIAPPDDDRFLIVTPAKFLTATRLAAPYGEEIGALSDTKRISNSSMAKQYTATIKPYRMIRAARIMVAGLGITAAQANQRWLWGSTRLAFQYRSAKDITTYAYKITDSPNLARRDVLMEMDCSEFGSVTIVEPRYVVRSILDA